MVVPDDYKAVFNGAGTTQDTNSNAETRRQLESGELIELSIKPGNLELEEAELGYTWQVTSFEPLAMDI